jgi:hypothetical protein
MSDIRKYMNIVEGSGMRDYIEGEEAKRATAIMDNGGIEVGDFVNLLDWFNDIWAEVIRVYVSGDNPRYNNVTYITYSKDGHSRNTDDTAFGRLRSVKKPAEVDFKSGVFYTLKGKYNYGHPTVWPPVHGGTPGRGDGSNRYKEYHPNLTGK